MGKVAQIFKLYSGDSTVVVGDAKVTNIIINGNQHQWIT